MARSADIESPNKSPARATLKNRAAAANLRLRSSAFPGMSACLPIKPSVYDRMRRNEIREYDMAQQIQTLFVDDIDGGEAAGTVHFALDGVDYEIDLSTAHTDDLHRALNKYVGHARKVSGIRRGGRGAGRRGASATDTHKVREWAKAQGIEVKDRGRVPADVVTRYRETVGR
jgi:hypothetical protein